MMMISLSPIHLINAHPVLLTADGDASADIITFHILPTCLAQCLPAECANFCSNYESQRPTTN